MPREDPALDGGDIQKTWRGYPDTLKAIQKIRKAGWRIVREGKHYRAFCPCGEGGVDFSIPGTPRSDGFARNAILRDSSKCPDEHERIHKRAGRLLRQRKRGGTG